MQRQLQWGWLQHCEGAPRNRPNPQSKLGSLYSLICPISVLLQQSISIKPPLLDLPLLFAGQSWGETKGEHTRGFHKVKNNKLKHTHKPKQPARPNASTSLQSSMVYSTNNPIVHGHVDSIVTRSNRHLMFSDPRELNAADAYRQHFCIHPGSVLKSSGQILLEEQNQNHPF